MKKSALIFLLLILMFNFISAVYVCSEGEITETKKEIELGKTKNINGIILGLGRAKVVSYVTNRIEADLIIEGKYVLLNDSSVWQTIELEDETEYNVSLVNSSLDQAKIKIGSSSDNLEVNEIKKIGELEVLLMGSEGSYPNDTTKVEVMVGIGKILLSNEENYNEIVNYNDKEFLVEIFSVSNEDVIIKVMDCENENATIEEVDEIMNNTEINETNIEENETNTEEVNFTNEDLNESSETNVVNNSDETKTNEDDEVEGYLNSMFIYTIIGFIIVFLILLIVYLKHKKTSQEIPVSENNESQ